MRTRRVWPGVGPDQVVLKFRGQTAFRFDRQLTVRVLRSIAVLGWIAVFEVPANAPRS